MLRYVDAERYVRLETGDGPLAAWCQVPGPLAVHPDRLLGRIRAERFVRSYTRSTPPRFELQLEPLPDDPASRTALLASLPEAAAELRMPFYQPPFAPLEPLPPEYWESLEPAVLDRDEGHIREAVAVLAGTLPPGAGVADVACSSGACLEAILEGRPDLTAWGFDLSPRMVSWAARRLERFPAARVVEGDAREPLPVHVALCVVRAVGQDVAARPEALRMVRAALEAVRPDGIVVVTAVTPPAVGRAELEAAGARVESTLRWDPVRQLLFPFLVARPA